MWKNFLMKRSKTKKLKLLQEVVSYQIFKHELYVFRLVLVETFPEGTVAGWFLAGYCELVGAGYCYCC
jgi:hypothetical protein